MVDSSSIAFWGILGGLSLLCVVTILLVYFICFSRNPKFCLSAENEELLETTVHHEEVHTVTSETRTSVSDCEEPTVVRRTEHVHRVIRKQRSWGNVLQAQKSEPVTKILVSPRSEPSNI
ncbi:uncharacterized protein LOC123529451 [Mercenaria mercenaria]|uniref:uncharacterized protein LOC123529451 n=1 Tax=Mercenaria mercenaria TaxID=6596 RepID=UPI00234EFF69|nr:uncharacterized protein LOC123529451 [Mercenaria mercenaria]